MYPSDSEVAVNGLTYASILLISNSSQTTKAPNHNILPQPTPIMLPLKLYTILYHSIFCNLLMISLVSHCVFLTTSPIMLTPAPLSDPKYSQLVVHKALLQSTKRKWKGNGYSNPNDSPSLVITFRKTIVHCHKLSSLTFRKGGRCS